VLRKKSLKYVFGISTFLYGTVFIAAPAFVALWLGGDMKIVARVIQILSVGSYVVSMNIPAYTILNGLGFAQDTLKAEVQRSIVHVVSIVLLVFAFGFYGFCAAFTLSIFYNYYITNHYYKKRVGEGVRLYEYLSNWKTDIAIALLLMIAYICVHFFGLASYFSLAVFFLGLAGCYGLLTWQLRFFTAEDLTEIVGPALIGRIRAKWGSDR
jgi:O-antigen/teichoic acid export membrane protein